MTKRSQHLKRVDKLLERHRQPHVVCRTCGVQGCCQLAHDNLRTPQTPIIMPLGFGYDTRYEQNRDPFYSLEKDPTTGEITDCRDRD